MEKTKQKCLICNSEATRKLHHENGQGFFLLCEKDVCKEVLHVQLQGAFRNQN